MKRKNRLFGACVAFIIVFIVVSLLIGIHRDAYRKAISLQINSTQPAASLTSEDRYHSYES